MPRPDRRNVGLRRESSVRLAAIERSSVRNRTNEFLRTFVASSAASPGARAAVMQDLGQLFGAGQPPERCLDLFFVLEAAVEHLERHRAPDCEEQTEEKPCRAGKDVLRREG